MVVCTRHRAITSYLEIKSKYSEQKKQDLTDFFFFTKRKKKFHFIKKNFFLLIDNKFVKIAIKEKIKKNEFILFIWFWSASCFRSQKPKLKRFKKKRSKKTIQQQNLVWLRWSEKKNNNKNNNKTNVPWK